MTRFAARRRALRVAGTLMAASGLLWSGTPGAGAAITSSGRPAIHHAPHASPGPAVHGVHPVAFHFRKPRNQADRRYAPRAARWPSAGPAKLILAAAATSTRQGAAVARVPGSPVWAQAVAGGAAALRPRTLDVRVLGRAQAQAAGVNGVLFAVSAPGGGPGAVRVGLDYRAFAQAYGGNYGSRLVLSELPACALTTPARPACRQAVPLRSANDWATKQVSAPVSVTSAAAGLTGSGTANAPAVNTVVLAASSGNGQEGGPAGNYAATTLKPSGTWSGGGSTGSFTYTYPITVPPAASTLAPPLSLNYNSSRVDGQTASTQAQASWAGDGWSTGDSFVEQSFIPCDDNPEGSAAPQSTPDECYGGPVLTMSLNGNSTSLVCNSAETSCSMASDNGDVVKHVTSSGNGTGTYNTDYWTITERDGTVYEFGRNQLPGWSSGKATTNSVDSVPVYSAHSGDPCYSSSGFSASVCTMAYRWNLDYVKDVHGNAMAYYYNQSTNYYGEDKGAHNVSYVRSSNLDHIDYGFTDGNAYGTVPDKIVFKTGDRCVSGTCDPLNSTNAKNWPDVPYDLVCASGATCTTSQYAPSFFSTVRLTAIDAEQYSTASSSYATVDSWALNETLPATGDGTTPTLWLASITHTGSDTTAGGSSSISLPPVSFTGIDLQNRVDTVTDGLPPLYRFRIATITTETGSVISTTYGQPKPCSAPVTTTPSSNTSSCYPVYWTPAGYTAPFLDWFNSYVVNSVSQTDPTGGAPPELTSYKYLGGAAWHFDDNELVQPKYRTYGQFRGYGDVQTRTGDGVNDPQTLAETTYYRGMSDDNNSTAVTLTDSAGGTHDDNDQLAGMPLEATSYLGDGGPVDHSTITSYWVSPAAQTRTRSGLPSLTANFVGAAESYTRQAVTDGGTTKWQNTETDTTYDSAPGDADFGLVTESYSHTVPAVAAYDKCTTTSYAPVNTGANLAGLADEVETDSVACGGFTEGSPASVPSALNTLTAPGSVTRPDQVISDTRTFYDDPTFATTFPQGAPAKGDVTMTQQATGYSGGAFSYQTTKRTTYDSYGRPVTSYDGNGNKTTTSYTMNSAGLTTGSTVTNPLGQQNSSTIDPERALTLTSTDPNGVVTTEHYDALGRVTGVWLNSRATTSPANYTYSYNVSNTGVTAVTSQKLNDESGYQTSVEIYDAMLRPRQTQSITPQGGRMVTDKFYDSRGWVSAVYNGWWDPATTPNATLVSAANLHAEVPNQDYYSYDGLGRVVFDHSEKDNLVVSTTTTVYNGDRTTTIPPQGGITKATVTDPLGRTAELDEYTTAPTLNTPSNTFTGIFSVAGGAYNATKYGYDGHGYQATMTDANGSTWTSTYNLLGQITAKADPDAGTIGMVHDGNGNITQVTDGRGKTTSYTYDALNRRTGEYDAPTASQSSANQLASWAYDNSNNAVPGMTNPIGQLTTETAYSGGAAYITQQKGFNVFGESLGTTVTIPSSTEGSTLGTSYAFSHVYTGTTGLLLKDIYPAAGGLPSETVLHGYATALDLPTTVGGLSGYSQGVTYDAYGRVNQETLGSAPSLAYLTDTYDQHTGNITDQLVTRAVATPANVDEEAYTYNQAGDITAQASTRLGSAASSETQCYNYDKLDRLTMAWTATDNCAATPSSSNSGMVGDNLGASSAYWTSWSYDPVGNRSGQVQHSLTGGADTTTSYTYNGNGAGQPGTLTGTATTGGATGSTSYGYDSAGNMTSRNAGSGSQTLTWSDTGLLTGITGGTGGDSHFVYDADGNLLLEKDPGATTLYLPGEQITLSGGSTTGVRYYTLPGGGLAYRTGTGTAYGFEITDLHGTPFLTLDNTAQVPAWRQFTPFGAPRGTSVTWPDNRGFLDKPADANTGLTVVGAREYDPGTGRFVSLDPILEATSPQELNGYTYAADNPVSQADPSGLMLCADGLCGSVQYLEHHVPSGGGGGGGNGCGVGGCGGICYYCHYAPPQYYGGGGGGVSRSGCGYTIACSAPWALPPQPRIVMVPGGGFECAHDGLCEPHPVAIYHNPNTDWDMAGEFLTGIGGRNQYFNQWDPLTQSLMHDSNTATTISIIQQQLRNPMELAVFAHHPLTGSHNYVDKPNPVNFLMDGLGALTGGHLGHNFADSFTGSYTQQYTVVNRGPNTATAYFTVENQTNLNSLVHPQQTWPFVPIISGYFSIKSVSLPWDAGPFSEIDQTFQWQETIHY